MDPFILGLDISYSSVKMAYGHERGKPATLIIPAGAAPSALMARKMTGEDASGLIVQINGEKWVAGVEPSRLQGRERELHEDYPASDVYRALFYAALVMSQTERIDMLVTGLPVEHFMDADRRQILSERLGGDREITPKRTVAVDRVMIVPQPVGTYMAVALTSRDDDLLHSLDRGRSVVIDPGFFSVDWVVLEDGEIRHRSSATSLKAMSVALEETARAIACDHGGAPSVEKLERSLRAGETDIMVFGKRVAIAPYLERV